jgi:hypothetical protein
MNGYLAHRLVHIGYKKLVIWQMWHSPGTCNVSV